MENALCLVSGVLGLSIVLGLMLLGARAGGDTGASADRLARVSRSRTDVRVSGVCSGLGKHTAFPTWTWRFTFVTLLLCGGSGLLMYIVLWFVLPREEKAEQAA